MKILVPIKRVVDPYVRIRVKADGTGVDLAGAKMAPNPFDEIALEAALRIKEAGGADEVVAVSIGSEQCKDVLRTALAMGADRAVLVRTDEALEPLAVAKALAKLAATEAPGLVILGKQAIDGDCGQTGQMLSALLDWPQATYAASITLSESVLTVTRDTDRGSQKVEMDLPAVVTTDLRLNEPRRASLPNIMKARQKPIEECSIESLGIDFASRLQISNTTGPSGRKAGTRVGSVAELVDRLRNEAAVI